jgi:hypothetical protein
MKRAPNPTKTSQPYIPSYQEGGLVTKPTDLQNQIQRQITEQARVKKENDQKIVQEAKEASKFSNKAKAVVVDVMSGVGSALNPKTIRRTHEFYKLREQERLGAEAKKRLEAGNKEKAK